MNLETLLHSTFGFPAFRANQEAVCRAATDGRDVLLVMPTGAGKSLCYQLPAVARGGTALVISPLIALMDDQANKLTAAGLRVARIHSGLSREDARQACRDYLDGTLQFLFIAPERMRVPGFPEMLAKKKPALIAIDEAHCISAWGHDFRPDYRTLGDHLPALRPAPIIALTATATPTVQKDIVAQLNLQNPSLFIHGFRRENLAIEVVEMSKPRRTEFAVKLLKDKSNVPAIVYAPSRKAAEELAGLLGSKAAAYHAGLDPATRERVQRHFLGGHLEIVVATIAFGMGIDKADVRTVLHIALPGSVEAYYQEIGRAGRDGLPSRTILLHSFVDRKIHETFLERDYPPATELDRVARALKPEFLMPEPLWRQLRMSPDIFGKAVEKLASQGAAQIDMAGNVRGTGLTTWRTGYETQVAFRKSQIERMATFADIHQCRMTALIRHFGDTADGTRPCGHCDACDPASATSQSTLRPPDSEELRQLAAVLRALDGQSRSTGKLHTELAAGALRGTPAEKDRRTFDALLDCLSRAALISITPEQWTNPAGDLISFKKAALTYEGREAAEQGLTLTPGLLLRETDAPTGKKGKTASPKATRRAVREDASAAFTPAQRTLEASLRDWRKAEAAKTGKPAFIIFGDAVLTAIVDAQPTTISALLNVSGIGPEKADRYGAAICALCRNELVETTEYGTPARKAKPARQSKLSLSKNSSEAVPHPSSALSTKGEVKSSKESSRSEERYPSRVSSPAKPSSAQSAAVPRPAFVPKPAATNPQPEVDLTPDQQAIDTRLREWRKTESERLGLPQFFVLGSSTLRSVVLQQPKTIAALQSISGIGPEKAAKFGPAILQVLNTSF